MKRMWSKNELNNISNANATAIATALISSLAVNKMEAPTSTTLTDEQIAKIIDGVFIEGTFLAVTNPVFFPAVKTESVNYGIIMYQTSVGLYVINNSTKVISISAANAKDIVLRSIASLNGKSIPNYPAETGTFTLKIVDGVITWVED